MEGLSGDSGDALATLFLSLEEKLGDDFIWLQRVREAARGERGVHLGVFVQPYLGYILDGTKTVESRFSVNKCAPWERVNRGDLLLLKASGGPVVGICEIGRVWSYQLDPATWSRVRSEFTSSLCAQDPGFWEARARAGYATLMRVERVRSMTPVIFHKRDRRGWVILSGSKRVDFPLLNVMERTDR